MLQGYNDAASWPRWAVLTDSSFSFSFFHKDYLRNLISGKIARTPGAFLSFEA
jgi:hypothetical protein